MYLAVHASDRETSGGSIVYLWGKLWHGSRANMATLTEIVSIQGVMTELDLEGLQFSKDAEYGQQKRY